MHNMSDSLKRIGFVMLCQVAATNALYYLRIVTANHLVQSDMLVIGLPLAATFALHSAVISTWRTGVEAPTGARRFVLAGGLSALGFLVSMFIALNAWGS